MCRKVAKEIIWTPAKVDFILLFILCYSFAYFFSQGKPHPPQDDAIDLLVDIITLMAVKKLEYFFFSSSFFFSCLFMSLFFRFTTNEIVLQLLKVPDRYFSKMDFYNHFN